MSNTIQTEHVSFTRDKSFDGKHVYNQELKYFKAPANFLVDNFFHFSNFSMTFPESLEAEFILYTFCEIENTHGDFYEAANDIDPLKDSDETRIKLDKFVKDVFTTIMSAARVSAEACLKTLSSKSDEYVYQPLVSAFNAIILKSQNYLDQEFGLLFRVRVEDKDVDNFLNSSAETYAERRKFLTGKPIAEVASVRYLLMHFFMFCNCCYFKKMDDPQFVLQLKRIFEYLESEQS